jgi:hypothetical protein
VGPGFALIISQKIKNNVYIYIICFLVLFFKLPRDCNARVFSALYIMKGTDGHTELHVYVYETQTYVLEGYFIYN